MTDKTKALLWRALLGLILVELPVVTYQLQQPTFDYRVLAVGLLGAAAGWLEKNVTFDLAPTQPVIVIPHEPVQVPTVVTPPVVSAPPIPPASQNPNVEFPGSS